MDPSDRWRDFAETEYQKNIDKFQLFNRELEGKNHSCRIFKDKQLQGELNKCLMVNQRKLFLFLSRMEQINDDLEACWKKAEGNAELEEECKTAYDTRLENYLDESIADVKK